MNHPRVYFSSLEEFEKIISSPLPETKLPIGSVFNLKPYLLSEPDFSELCPFFVAGSCKFANKCNNYHPVVITEAECMMCKAKIKGSLREFGLLSNCADIFCFPCIRHWRSRGNVSQDLAQSCPVCSRQSQVLVSSAIFPLYFEDKTQLLDKLLYSKSK